MVLKNGSTALELTPPHDILDKKTEEFMPGAKSSNAEKTRDLLHILIRRSWEILPGHPINIRRKESNMLPANSIWPWSAGYKPEMPTITERFGLKGAVISAVDLIKGLGIYAGLNVIHVDGITGKYDTNYEGKADYALEALKDYDLVFVHVEAPDEAGHAKDYELKIKTIQDLDKRLIGRIMNNINQDVTLAVLPDHPTPIKIGTHTRDPVPFAFYSPVKKADNVKQFDENSAKKGKHGTIHGEEFMRLFLDKTPKS